MRLLADENFSLPTVAALRQAGHDVTTSGLTSNQLFAGSRYKRNIDQVRHQRPGPEQD